ncbi:MAG: hypothetical protein IK020_02125 [Clostridiales bacterium]|nr:hypothetical protein [Clostridiales bacterium]
MKSKEEYQKNCSDEIIKRIVRGKRRLSLFVPTGAGKTGIVFDVIKRIGAGQKILVVYELPMEAEGAKARGFELDPINIEFVCAKDVVDRKLQADVYFLMGLRAYSRQLVFNSLGQGNRALVISIISMKPLSIPQVTPSTEISNMDYVVTMGEKKMQICIEHSEDPSLAMQKQVARLNEYLYTPWIIETKDVLDPRDIVLADEEEKRRLCEWMKKEREMAKNFALMLSGANIVPDLYSFLLRRLQCSDMLLEACGISLQEVDDAVIAIELERKAMSKELNSSDEMVRERAISAFEKKVSDRVLVLLKDLFAKLDSERSIEILKGYISDEIWENKLSEETKTCLITAKTTFDVMSAPKKVQFSDYSGVCLLVTKSVDIEVSKRLFRQYVNYLEERFPLHSHADRWPRNLLTSDQTSVIQDKDFTLGTVAYIVGIDKDGAVKNNYVYRLFMEYARDALYVRDMTDEERTQRVRKLVECVEKIRTDFRNPAAHREGIQFVTAKECMDYTIETYKKLREILECMSE